LVNKKKLKKVKKSEKVLDNTYSNDYISSRKRENKAKEKIMNEKRIKELNKKHNFSLVTKNGEPSFKINIDGDKVFSNPSLLAEVKAGKPEIIAYLQEQEIAEDQRIKREVAEEMAEKEAPFFAEAKKTNEKQVIEKYTIPCRDHREECNTDIVTIYAMPDGSKKTTCVHTW